MHRRSLLRFLAGSPLLAASPAFAQLAADLEAGVLTNPEAALNVFDFEAAARRMLVPAHYGYMASGVDDDVTLRANRQGFEKYRLRPRRLVDVSQAHTRTTLFGEALEAPIFLCPVGGLGMFNPEGAVTVARAARSRNMTQVLSSAANAPVEAVNEARGAPIWFQLYARPEWSDTRPIVERAQAAGCKVLVWTVDLLPGRNMETDLRARMTDTTDCSVCHTNNPRPTRRPPRNAPAPFTWDFVGRLRDATDMKILIKGIETSEDAQLCVERGADGVIVSNHGGRATETGRATIESLSEVVAGVNGRVPVIVDGGFRRGSDIFKALALGASAVGVGRPYVWGLASFGQAGVERVIDLLREELLLIMRQCGVRSVAEIGPQYLA